mmetsp:Transcript_31024/g.51658  ORF Transcript_31024/g.51658 Transcript_31024/m.51658 type:complete len:227 (-) Transcript_31024:2395-3075(-)
MLASLLMRVQWSVSTTQFKHSVISCCHRRRRMRIPLLMLDSVHLVINASKINNITSTSWQRFPFSNQRHVANRRKEKAKLIVEYNSLLPSWRRLQIEHNTQYFHALLQADADGDLIVEDNDWQGGLAALREHIEELNEAHEEAQQKAVETLKNDFEKELSSLRSEMVSILRDLSDDVKAMKRSQTEGGVFSGKRVAGAVRAVKEIRQASASLLMAGGKKEPEEEEI